MDCAADRSDTTAQRPATQRCALRWRIDTYYGLTRRQGISRRSFVKFCSLTAASLGLGDAGAQQIAQAMQTKARTPLASYRAAELERMKLNFFGFDSSYHVARFNFVHKVPRSRTPLYLARHRRGVPVTGEPAAVKVSALCA
jgi:hypothetical protein